MPASGADGNPFADEGLRLRLDRLLIG